MRVLTLLFLLLPLSIFAQSEKASSPELPLNTWVRISDSPGDALGREIPPGRGSSWVYSSESKVFYRYGGFTPRYSNAIFSFDPIAKVWKEVIADDEHYPETRAPGVAGAALAWDEKRKRLWIGMGVSSVKSGKRGIWTFNPEDKQFKFIGKSPQRSIRKICFALDMNIGVFAPAKLSSGYPKGGTYVLDLTTGNSKLIRSKLPAPHRTYRGSYPIVYHSKLKKMIVVSNFKNLMETWAFDLKTFVWEKLSEGGPPAKDRTFFNIAYDEKNNVVILQGGHNGRDAAYYGAKKFYRDTWAFDVEKKEWKEIKIEGPNAIRSKFRKITYSVISHTQAFTYFADWDCIMLSDPDLGVWAFKYDPTKSLSSKNINTGFNDKPGSAGSLTPAIVETDDAKIKTNEVRRELPSGLNQKLIDLPDNTLIPLKGSVVGNEVAWVFSEKFGVFFKYGGCGNNSAPFWGGYGNDLGYYDPVNEQFYSRRVGDISGADRPGTGCTRSVVWDTKRDVVWFLGGTASGPFPPRINSGQGSHTYDPEKDLFKKELRVGKSYYVSGHHTYLSYSPEGDMMVVPRADGVTAHFLCKESRFVSFKDTNSPGPLINYSRTLYVDSKKATFMIYPIKTGKTSTEKPADFKNRNEAAKERTQNYWSFNKKKKLYEEKTLATFLYHSSKKKWERMITEKQPPYRESKYGIGYDPYNDIVFLAGGHIGWNGPTVKDFWAYHVKENRWEELKPNYPNKKQVPSWGNSLKADYDTRHHAFIFTNKTNRIWAYRYKKGDWKPE